MGEGTSAPTDSVWSTLKQGPSGADTGDAARSLLDGVAVEPRPLQRRSVAECSSRDGGELFISKSFRKVLRMRYEPFRCARPGPRSGLGFVMSPPVLGNCRETGTGGGYRNGCDSWVVLQLITTTPHFGASLPATALSDDDADWIETVEVSERLSVGGKDTETDHGQRAVAGNETGTRRSFA